MSDFTDPRAGDVCQCGEKAILRLGDMPLCGKHTPAFPPMQTAQSCPACDDDGRPCYLCKPVTLPPTKDCPFCNGTGRATRMSST